jgi:hypothetical protein
MMGQDISRALDPVLLAQDCGITLDPWQAELLRTPPRRALLCCSRQSGKSTAVALLGLWTAIFEPPALVLLLSPSLRQSGELFRMHGLSRQAIRRADAKHGKRLACRVFKWL